MLLRNLYLAGIGCGWDDPLPEAEQASWQTFIDAAISLQSVSVPRAVVTRGSKGLWLIGFWDGSLDAYSCCIYARSRVEGEWGDVKGHHTQLLFAKTRVAPLEGSTIAKMELQGMVQLTRSLVKVVRALEGQVERCVIAGDSMSCLMAVRRPGGTYKPYLQNRVGEVQRNLQLLASKNTIVEEPLKIAGTANPADIGTRGRASLEDIGPASLWQLGPDFLCQDRDSWPLEVPEEVNGAVPASEVRQRAVVCAVNLGPGERLGKVLEQVMTATEDLHRATSVLARVLAGMASGVPGSDPQ